MKTLFALAMTLVSTTSLAADNMKAFPPAEEGMVRYVINLPEQVDEAGWRAELLVRQTVQLDAANRYFFAGTLETETIEGWGFDRHILRKLGPMAGTLMAVDPRAPGPPESLSQTEWVSKSQPWNDETLRRGLAEGARVNSDVSRAFSQ